MRRMPSHRERRQPNLIDKFLTLRKIESNDLVPRRWFIPPWPLHFASPMMTRTLTVVDPRIAIRGHVHQLHILCKFARGRSIIASRPSFQTAFGGRGDPGERRAPDVPPGSLRSVRDDGAPLTPGLAVANGVRGRRNPLKRLDFVEGKKLRIFLSLAWIFLPPAWILLPPLRVEGELGGGHS